MQVYSPDELYKAVKDLELPASELLQEAVEAELRRQELNRAADDYLGELVEDVGEPSMREHARAANIARRIRERAAARELIGARPRLGWAEPAQPTNSSRSRPDQGSEGREPLAAHRPDGRDRGVDIGCRENGRQHQSVPEGLRGGAGRLRTCGPASGIPAGTRPNRLCGRRTGRRDGRARGHRAHGRSRRPGGARQPCCRGRGRIRCRRTRRWTRDRSCLRAWRTRTFPPRSAWVQVTPTRARYTALCGAASSTSETRRKIAVGGGLTWGRGSSPNGWVTATAPRPSARGSPASRAGADHGGG